MLEFILVVVLALFAAFIYISLRDYLRRKKASGLFFCLLILSSCIWVTSLYYFVRTDNVFIGNIAAKFIWVAAPQLITHLFLFVYYYRYEGLGEKYRPKAFFVFFAIFLSIFLSVVSVSTDYVVSETDINIRKIFYGPVYYAIVAYIVTYSIFIYRTISQHRSLVSGQSKSAVDVIFWGINLTLFSAIFTNIIIPLVLGNSRYSYLGIFSSMFINISITYAILRYKLFDIRVFVGRITYYFLLGTIVTTAFYAVLVADILLFGDSFNIKALLMAIPFSVLFIAFYDTFKKFIQTRVESRLINPGFDPNEVIVEFNKTASTILDFDLIGMSLEEVISKTIRPDFITIYLKRPQSGELVLKRKTDEDLKMNFEGIMRFFPKVFFNYIYLDLIEVELPAIFISNFNELSVIVEEMKDQKVKLILPIGKDEAFSGYIILGSKEGDSPYNSVQIKYLQSLCEISSLALARSKLYEEVQQFNETLQEKVKIATEEIQNQNNKLSEALRIERDMLDVLGHELRTPLGTIRNSMGVVELKYKAKTMRNEDLESFFHIGGENIKREIQLLETILASAKIDNDKLDMNFEKVDARDVASDSFEAYKYDAEKKGLKLVLSLPENEMFAYADRIRIQQVMDNLTSNAVKYTPAGQIEVKLEDEGKFLRFSVIDTGEGIPEEDIAKLGTKFFRANMYLNSQGKLGDRKIIRPGGTGIGLYVVYQIVKFMYGEVDVKSKLGKGSTFSFTVLKYTEELANRASFILAGKDTVRRYNEETRVQVK
jgi:signal transduction histidine kinase